MSFRFHPEARVELIESAQFYEAGRPGSGALFLRAAYLAAEGAGQHPLRARRDVEGFYRVAIKRYPYWLVYDVELPAIYIFAVSHHRREPGYWLHRVH